MKYNITHRPKVKSENFLVFETRDIGDTDVIRIINEDGTDFDILPHNLEEFIAILTLYKENLKGSSVI